MSQGSEQKGLGGLYHAAEYLTDLPAETRKFGVLVTGDVKAVLRKV